MANRGSAAPRSTGARAPVATRRSNQAPHIGQTSGTGVVRNGPGNSGQNRNNLASSRGTSMLGSGPGSNTTPGNGTRFSGWGNGTSGSGYRSRFSGWGNGNSGYGYGNGGYGYGNGGYGYGNNGYGYGSGGYGSGYGNSGLGYGGRNSQYTWVFIPSIGWVMIPTRSLLMLAR
jgi:hypothetical protein